MLTDKLYQLYNGFRFNRLTFKTKKNGYVIGKKVSFLHPEYISLGKNVFFGDLCSIQTWPSYRGHKHKKNPELTIEDDVSMMSNCLISCMNKVYIGSGCLLGDNVFITDNYHGKTDKSEANIKPIERYLYSKGPVIIGKNVWIGRNVCIMPGVTIGDGSIIGANSVVTHDIPKMTISGGVPARIIMNIC